MKHRVSVVSKQLDSGNYDVAILVDGEIEAVFKNICDEWLQAICEIIDNAYD